MASFRLSAHFSPGFLPHASQWEVKQWTYPPHSRPEALCQAPQAAQVLLETAQLQRRSLGSVAGTVNHLG